MSKSPKAPIDYGNWWDGLKDLPGDLARMHPTQDASGAEGEIIGGAINAAGQAVTDLLFGVPVTNFIGKLFGKK